MTSTGPKTPTKEPSATRMLPDVSESMFWLILRAIPVRIKLTAAPVSMRAPNSNVGPTVTLTIGATFTVVVTVQQGPAEKNSAAFAWYVVPEFGATMDSANKRSLLRSRW